jgi:hypothetical protein
VVAKNAIFGLTRRQRVAVAGLAARKAGRVLSSGTEKDSEPLSVSFEVLFFVSVVGVAMA